MEHARVPCYDDQACPSDNDFAESEVEDAFVLSHSAVILDSASSKSRIHEFCPADSPVNSKETPPPLTAVPAIKHLAILGKIMTGANQNSHPEIIPAAAVPSQVQVLETRLLSPTSRVSSDLLTRKELPPR